MRKLPQVTGGDLLECVGGPLDGEIVFLKSGESLIDVGHFYDDRRTPWLGGAHPGADNYLGCYVPRQFENGAAADWRPATVTDGAPGGGR